MRALYIAASGMAAQQLNVDVIANNLANVNTVGFKRSRGEFQDLLYQIKKDPGSPSSTTTQYPSGIQIGHGVKTVSVQRLFTQGDLQQTDNELDVAIEGDGFFQVTQPNGEIGYTRSGSFTKDRDGNLVTNDGFQLTPTLTIPADATRTTIGVDGTVSVMQAGNQTASEIGKLDLVRFGNPLGLLSVGRNLYRPTSSSGDPITGSPGQAGFGTLAQGFIEGSNVNIVEELVGMITGQRAYEINSTAIKTADEMLQMANSLKR